MEHERFYQDILAARERIKMHVKKTALDLSPVLSDIVGNSVYIKLESEQTTGSFKLRGAYNKVCLLHEKPDSGKSKQPVTASTGNHALACIHAMTKMSMEGTVIVPETISSVKEDALRRAGASLLKHGTDCIEGELKARSLAQESGRPYISPYNDWDVVAGQGTIGLEILEDLPNVDIVFVPVGGGGLIGGIAACLKYAKPDIKIVGCQPENSKVMFESVKAGKIVFEESYDTLSDGTAGGIEKGAVTFELCRDYVDDWVMVSEDEIARAVYFMMEHHHKIVEGAAGVSIGAYMKTADNYKDKVVVIVACGSNISMAKLKFIINKCSAEK